MSLGVNVILSPLAQSNRNTFFSPFLLIVLFLLHIGLELVLVLLSPAAQRRPTEEGVVRVPLHAAPVHVLRHVVVRTEHPELALGHFGLQVIYDLLGRPLFLS